MAEGPRTERTRRPLRGVDRGAIARRVIRLAQEDRQAHAQDRDARLQRYAKYRQWTEGASSWRWEGASDVPLPDLTTSSLRMQDTLHNSVMSARPAVVARAVRPVDRDAQAKIDRLQDYQFFVEQQGEKLLEEITESFVNDGVFTAFIPWVRETRPVRLVRTFAAPADADDLGRHFHDLLRREFPGMALRSLDDERWDWEVTEGRATVERPAPVAKVRFYTTAGGIEMVIDREAVVYEGPRVISKDIEEVLTPARVANLQMPGPSNPGGAPHVILVDHPTIDEIRRLARQGRYDALRTKDLETLDARSGALDAGGAEAQRDAFQGVDGETPTSIDRSQDRLTRLVCFDAMDIDGDGIDEDMVWWVLEEPGLLLRARRLTEEFPCDPPRRPFAEASFLPVRGRREGIGLLELEEGLHDVKKQLFDLGIDSGTLTTTPFFFYRASSQMKPETLSLGPGDGAPLANPKEDVVFPNLQSSAQPFVLNLLTKLEQMDERLTVIGDLQLGRVPPGKSSAFRTAGGMASLLSQGEARPQRILRRFFMGLTEIWRQMYERNRAHLPPEKRLRVVGALEPGEDPFLVVRHSDLQGRYLFDFTANVQNSSAGALQQTLQGLMGILVTPLAIQLGVSTPDTIYRLFREWTKALGQDPDEFLRPPTPASLEPGVVAEEVIAELVAGRPPQGQPIEPLEEHLATLLTFQRSAEVQFLPPEAVPLLEGWIQKIRQRIVEASKQQALAQAAGDLQARTRPEQGREAAAPDTGAPPVEKNELIDESLPSAQGRIQ